MKIMPLAVLLSGSGTTLQNLLDRADTLPARVACVVSNKADAYGLERARYAGIPAYVVERKVCASREEFSQRILGHCEAHGAELICMAGFLQLLDIPPRWVGRVMNVHPALLPAFGGKGYHGLRVHEAVLEAGVKVSGCTVHFADNEYDQGPIIVQRTVEVKEDDTAETLQARVMEAEREAYPEAVRLFVQGRLRLEGRRVRVLSA
jgi:formyltetrahydrofolate-dependent phosphoribosylglycinamide formyltransferase